MTITFMGRVPADWLSRLCVGSTRSFCEKWPELILFARFGGRKKPLSLERRLIWGVAVPSFILAGLARFQLFIANGYSVAWIFTCAFIPSRRIRLRPSQCTLPPL
ncbi:MAG: hypothetical protein KDE29_23600, partial [Anaerolineales bacterium]|nr:hypothetical protein [Anaerolineales bacterium]